MYKRLKCVYKRTENCKFKGRENALIHMLVVNEHGGSCETLATSELEPGKQIPFSVGFTAEPKPERCLRALGFASSSFI